MTHKKEVKLAKSTTVRLDTQIWEEIKSRSEDMMGVTPSALLHKLLYEGLFCEKQATPSPKEKKHKKI